MAESDLSSSGQPAAVPVPTTEDAQVVERVTERTADPASGTVTEHVVRTVTSNPAAPVSAPPAAAPATPAFSPPPAAAPHAPPGDVDETYYDGSPLLRGEFGRVFPYGLAAIALFAAPFLAHRAFKNGLPIWLSVALVLVGIVLLIIPFVMTKSVRYRVTNYRISWERGVLTKDIDTLELWHVEDLTFRQSIYQRLMGVGTIHILSHDRENPNLVLESVPDARKLFSTLQQRVIAVKRTGGVVKIDSGR